MNVATRMYSRTTISMEEARRVDEERRKAGMKASFDTENLHAEKNPSHSRNIVARMNNLSPPVTVEEEKKVRRKIDKRLPPFLLVLYMFTWLDRSALGNAALMGIKEEMPLSGPEFSLAVSMFFVGTCIADLFTNLGMRFIRPSWYLAGAMIIWGLFATLQAVAGGASGMYAMRFFLGIFEAAFIAGAPYMITVMYPRAEWGRRICVYLAGTPLAGAFGGWVAYGVAHLDHNPKIKNWQILFLLEGLLTIAFGVLCIWVLPDRPHNTRWLTERERDVADWRMMRDGNRTHGKIDWRTVLNQLKDWRLVFNIAIYMGQVLSTYTIATFMPIIVATMGFNNVDAQLMVAPPYCVAVVMVFVVGYLSDRFKSCSGLLVINSVVAAIGFLMLNLIPRNHYNARYGATFLVVTGILSGVALTVGNITSNCCGDVKKAIASGFLQACGSTMGIATGYLFPARDGPDYTIGFWTLFGATVWTGFGAGLVTFINWRENRRRDEVHGVRSDDNIVVDFESNGLMEKHPDWRYYL